MEEANAIIGTGKNRDECKSMSTPTIPGDLMARTRPATAVGDAPVVIEARDIYKTFHIPDHRVDSLKERVTHPLRRVEHQRASAQR